MGTESSTADFYDPTATLKHIGFGSCNKQSRPKSLLVPLYNRLQEEHFDLWVWTGDVVYTVGSSLEALRTAYEQFNSEESIDRFTKSVGRIIGTWDDHDLGMNDGGNNTPNLPERQEMFLDFLKVPSDSFLRKRKGVYSSHEFGQDHRRVRFILLDTRSGRSDYAFGFLGTLGQGRWFGKLSPLLAASARSFLALTGISTYLNKVGYSNVQMLDDEQWQWLERQLTTSMAQVNVLVSSVQLLTMNPSVESWGHFPLERERLLKLIERTKPKGFLVLSGDVHIGIAFKLIDVANSPVVEVTSSGLTHTCTAGGIPHFICSLVWNLFETTDRTQSMMLSRNFGSIEIDWEHENYSVNLNSLTHNATFSFGRTFDPLPEFNASAVPGVVPPQSDLILLASMTSLMIMITIMWRFWSRRFR